MIRRSTLILTPVLSLVLAAGGWSASACHAHPMAPPAVAAAGSGHGDPRPANWGWQ